MCSCEFFFFQILLSTTLSLLGSILPLQTRAVLGERQRIQLQEVLLLDSQVFGRGGRGLGRGHSCLLG